MSLVSELNNIADELVECHTNLKNNLIAKGVECSDTDKMSSLIDKVDKLDYIEGLKNYPSWYINKTISNITNSSSNSHISCENMPTVRYCLTASSVMDKIYYIGGFTGSGSGYLSTNECYDPSTNIWDTKKNANTPKHLHTSSVVGNKIYCISGYGSAGTLTTNECYDPSTNTWTTKKNITTGRFRLNSSTVGNKIYCLGGNSNLTTNECYDPSTNTWTTKAGMTTGRHDFACSSIDNKIYCIGGGSSGSVNEYYDPSTNTWTTKASLPAPARSQLAGVNANGGIYCFGGVNGSNYYTHVHYYNPTSNTWTAKKSLGVGRYGLAVSAIDNKIYYTSGYGTNNLGNNHACYLV